MALITKKGKWAWVSTMDLEPQWFSTQEEALAQAAKDRPTGRMTTDAQPPTLRQFTVDPEGSDGRQ